MKQVVTPAVRDVDTDQVVKFSKRFKIVLYFVLRNVVVNN